MNLRGKTLILMAIIILSLTLSFFIISQIIFTSSSIESEQSYTTLVLKNTINSLNNDMEALNNSADDWANWDDAYNFLKGINPQFKDHNLIMAAFSRLNVNLILFIDNSNEIVYGGAYDLKSKKELPLPNNSEINLINKGILQNNGNRSFSGVILINGTPMIVVSRPVLKSSGQGPAQGTLIMGRYLDQSELKSLSDNAYVSVYPFNSLNIPSDVKKARSSLSNGSNFYVNTLNDDSIAGYSILKGVNNEPTLILKVELPRFIYKNYQNAIFFLILSLIIAGLLAAMFITYYLDKNVLFRLDQITTSIISIGKKNDLSARVPVLGNDELSDLSVSVNNTLKSLEDSIYDLKKSEERYKAIFENTGTAMIIIGENMVIRLVNTEFEHVTCFPKDEIENKKNLMDFVFKESLHNIREHHNFNEFRKKNQITNYEIKLKCKSGEIRDFYTTFGFIPGTENALMSLIDITEHKKAEDQIKASLKEKEILLREIHHRVKNNLQIISTLLALQSDKIEDEKIIENYRESENRIQSIALIHEKMYQSDDLSSIDFNSYITSLTNDLVYSYGFDSHNIEIDVGHHTLNIETGIPLGLIINELVSNSLKYAFRDKPSLKISVKLESFDNDLFKLNIKDNGVGFPENLDFKKTKSLGLQLVNSLVEQLNGTIKLINGPGTNFEIIFKELEYKKRI